MKEETKNLIAEAHAFSARAKELKAQSPEWLDFPDEIKLKCVDYLIRGISPSILSRILDIPRSTLRSWRYRAMFPTNRPLEQKSNESMQQFFKEKFHEISISDCKSIPRTRPALSKGYNVSVVFESSKGRIEVDNVESAHANAIIQEIFKCLSTPEP